MSDYQVDIENMINNVANQDFGKAGPTFVEILKDKMSDALEQEKVSVANAVFNGKGEEGLADDASDPDEEDIDAAIDELDDDELDDDEEED